MKKVIYVSFVLLISFAACNKDDLNLLNENKETKDVLIFDSFDDFNEELSKVIAMSSDELKTYEETKGYKSLGRASEELYYKTDFGSFSTQEELFSFVEKNKNFLNFIDDDSGELELETVLHDFPQRYLLNMDHIVQIDTLAFKFLKEGVIACDARKIDLLQEITSENFSSFAKHPEILTFAPKESSTQKSDEGGCGYTFAVRRETNGRNRTKLELKIEPFPGFAEDPRTGNKIPMVTFNNTVLVRPYHRTLGVWCWCSRTISWDLKIAVDREIDGELIRGVFKNSGTKKATSVSFTIDGGMLMGTFAPPITYYSGLDCWAKTPSTDSAIIQCNTSIAQ